MSPHFIVLIGLGLLIAIATYAVGVPMSRETKLNTQQGAAKLDTAARQFRDEEV